MSNSSLPSKPTPATKDTDSNDDLNTTDEVKTDKNSGEEISVDRISCDEDEDKYSQGIQLALVAVALLLSIFLVSLDMVTIYDENKQTEV